MVCVCVFVYDEAKGGKNCIGYCTLSSPKTVQESVRLPIMV